MTSGPIGGPRPFADDETTLSFIFSRRVQNTRKLKEMVISQVGLMAEMEPTSSSVTISEGSTIVDISIEDSGAKLSDLNELESNIESSKTAMDIRAGQLKEIVVR